MLSTILFSIVTPDCGLIQAQQYCSILLTTMNNVGSKTLNNVVLTALNRLCVFTRVAGKLQRDSAAAAKYVEARRK